MHMYCVVPNSKREISVCRLKPCMAIQKRARRPKFYSYMVCLDQEHVPRFLPTMLARVTPPRTFMVNQNREEYKNYLKSEKTQFGLIAAAAAANSEDDQAHSNSRANVSVGKQLSQAGNVKQRRPDFSQVHTQFLICKQRQT